MVTIKVKNIVYIKSFTKQLVAHLKSQNKTRTAERYATTLNSLIRFRPNEDIRLNEINSCLMQDYQEYLKDKGLSLNTISFYMRNLRAIYNRAVEQGLTTQQYPFKKVYTGISKTTKRSIHLEDIRNIKNMNLSGNHNIEWARDMFMFSFYTRGMSFVDMAFLTKTDIAGGVLSYRRKKTRQRLSIKIEKPIQDIVDKYYDQDSIYLLPIIKHKGNEWRQYKTANQHANRYIKKIGNILNIQITITMYVARHSWASIAKSKGIPVSVISECMGHDSEKTTLIYLASLDSSTIDNANRTILESL